MLRLPEFKAYVEPIVASLAGAMAVKFPNAPFPPPANANYLSFLYLTEESFSTAIGKKKRIRHVGGLQFEVYSRADSGTLDAETALEPFVDFFQLHQKVMGVGHQVTFFEFSRSELDQDGRHRIVLRVPYHRDVAK